MSVTIKDVAKTAEVSVATVSKVLNNYSDISEKTRKKVLRVVDELKYQPNANARSLTTRHTWTIGVFFTDHLNSGLRHPFFRDVIHSFKESIGSHGFDLLFFANTKWGYSFSYRERCMNRNVDGVIMMGMPSTDEYLTELIESEIPTMFVDSRNSGKKAGFVISDNESGAEKAVEYLINLGHRRIGTIIGQEISWATHERLKSYKKTLKKHGIPFDENLIRVGDFDLELGATAFRELMELKEPPTAVFCQSDVMALGALEMAKSLGIRIPEDVSIVGFDDIEIASHVTPTLTTIRQDKFAMGQFAAEALVNMILEERIFATEYVVDTELVIRDSCAPCKAEADCIA